MAPAGLVVALLWAQAGGAAGMAPAPSPSPSPSVFSGRGVYYFEGRIRCPFAGVGRRADRASNRIALDDEHTRVSIDPARGRILVDNSHAYPDKAVIADFTFLGSAATDSGERVPLAVHVKLEKKKDRVKADLHPHWTIRGKLRDAEIESIDIALAEKGAERVLVGRSDILRVATETKISYTVAGSLLEVKNNLEGKPPTAGADQALADISLGFGSKHVNRMLIRAELRAVEASKWHPKGKPPAPVVAPRTLSDRLRDGSWQLRLTALSSLLSQDTLRRDLFMLGLDRIPVIADGSRRGLAKGESVTFTVHDGVGRVAWGINEQELPAPLDVARAFLEFNFLGAVLARQVAKTAPSAPLAPSAPAPPAAPPAPPSPKTR